LILAKVKFGLLLNFGIFVAWCLNSNPPFLFILKFNKSEYLSKKSTTGVTLLENITS
jgi:hypothetical protein